MTVTALKPGWLKRDVETAHRNVYLAGPLFSFAERDFNARVAAQLRGHRHEVFLSQENQLPTAGAIFESDMKGLTWCDVVVAILDGSDPDSGTAWECGWAYAMGIPVIGVRTDFRKSGDHGDEPVNLMISSSVATLLAPTTTGVVDLVWKIDMELRRL